VLWDLHPEQIIGTTVQHSPFRQWDSTSFLP